jgi:hypothetical protein
MAAVSPFRKYSNKLAKKPAFIIVGKYLPHEMEKIEVELILRQNPFPLLHVG